MNILRCKNARFAGGVMLLVLLVSAFTWPGAAVAEERDFPAGGPKEKLVEEAIKFIKDNEGTNPTDADEDLTAKLATNAADGKKRLREETDEDLGHGETSSARIKVGLPPTNDINTDITTQEGFRQVKTLAQTLYHEWVHEEQFDQYNGDLVPPMKANWAACQPFWVEVEAYYKEIKLKLQWKLAREKRRAQIPGYGPIEGPPTPEQEAEAERLKREIDQLKAQIDELINKFLEPKRNDLGKSYEDNGNHLKAAFQGKTNQQKHDEVVARLNDVSKIDPNQPQQTIEEKIAAKVAVYRLMKWLEETFIIPVVGGIIGLYVTEAPYPQLFEMTAQPGTFYAPTQVTVACLSPDFMDPWKTMGYTILSPVYQVSAPVGAMANPAHPARVTLSYDMALAESCEFHLYRMLAAELGRDTPLWEVLPGEAVDCGAGIISGDSNEPFSLYVVMEEKFVSGASNPRPADGAVEIPLDADLCWPKSEEAVSYDVYFGTDFDDVKYGRRGTFKGSTTARYYDPGTLERCYDYYWRVEPVEEEEEEEIIVDWVITTGDVRIYADIFKFGEVWSFTTVGRKAMDPYPANGAIDVSPHVILSWDYPYCYIIPHYDVYFGIDFYAVANADTSDTTGIYRGRQALDANSYDPGGLEPGTTYHWKIHGVNEPTPEWQGDVWSFTGEVAATWTQLTVYYDIESEKGWEGWWKTAPKSGVIEPNLAKGQKIALSFRNDPDDKKRKYLQLVLKGAAYKHLTLVEKKGFEDGTDKKPMKDKLVKHLGSTTNDTKKYRRWRYRFGPPQPAWEQFIFKATKEIPRKSITVQAWSMCLKRGVKKPEWPEVTSFGAEGPGAADIEDYAFSIWDASFGAESPGAVTGVPRVTDIYLFPDSSAVNTLIPPEFSADPSTGNWTASFVYADPDGNSRPQGGVLFVSDGPGLGTSDRFALEVSMVGPIDSTFELYAYDQDSGEYMDFGIDAVDTPECTNVVDDMESYTDDLGNRIFETWIDGLGYTDPPPGHPGNGTGSRVGYREPPFVEQTIVYEGEQSMPFSYDNSTANYSQAERTFDTGQDWTAEGVEVLSLWFYGDPANAPEPMYVAVEDSMGTSAVVHHDNLNAAQLDTWTEWNIDLENFANQGVNLTNVKSIAIGAGDRDNPQPGGTGILYFDDIRLCPSG